MNVLRIQGKAFQPAEALKIDDQQRKLEGLSIGLSAKETMGRRCFTWFWVAPCSEMCSHSNSWPRRERLGIFAGNVLEGLTLDVAGCTEAQVEQYANLSTFINCLIRRMLMRR